MKTKILSWDVNIQGFLVIVNLLLMCTAFIIQDLILMLLGLQLFTAIYQLISSGVNLRLQHKSMGYQKFRLMHFWGAVVYLVLVYLLY